MSPYAPSDFKVFVWTVFVCWIVVSKFCGVVVWNLGDLKPSWIHNKTSGINRAEKVQIRPYINQGHLFAKKTWKKRQLKSNISSRAAPSKPPNQAGGGYVGICAGAYLGTSWGYDLLPVNVLDINHWDRGKTLKCQLKTTARGLQISPKLPKDFEIPYVNGPLFEILDSSVESLVDFESQLCGKDGTYPQVMRGSPAILAGPFGKGRVVLLSLGQQNIAEFLGPKNQSDQIINKSLTKNRPKYPVS